MGTFPLASDSPLGREDYCIVGELWLCSSWNPESSALTTVPPEPVNIQHQPTNFSLYILRQEQDASSDCFKGAFKAKQQWRGEVMGLVTARGGINWK